MKQMINFYNVRDELDIAVSVFKEIDEFIAEKQIEKKFETEQEKITNYITNRIDCLTELCPILYSLSKDSTKENVETQGNHIFNDMLKKLSN